MKLNYFGWVLCLLLVLFISSGILLAQTATTTVLGQITDPQGAALVSAKVKVTNLSTGLVRETTSDSTGNYQITSLPPGTYRMTVEMSGFRTVAHHKVELLVNTATRLNTAMQIGAQNETVEVSAAAEKLNTIDASVGNAFNENQIRQLPLEGRNVVGLLALQPGAVFVPTTYIDNRQGSISGSRGDQTNVTLDGVDVNDPNGYAYNSALRVTLDSTQEFRVTTTNYGADQGRSSAAQVSLVTKSGTNSFHGSAYAYHRNDAFSSNQYFNKASQLWARDVNNDPTARNKPPVLKKTIGGFSFGGPIKKDRLFFFFNAENLRQVSQNSVLRTVPSATFRDGILVYGCATPSQCPATSVAGISGKTYPIPAGYHGLTPAELASLDPLLIGPSVAASQYFQQYPLPNDPGRDTYNFAGYRWAAPLTNGLYTYITRWDYRLDASGNHTLTWRANLQDDASNSTPLFPGQDPQSTTVGNSRGMAASYTAVLSNRLVNTFRWGLTRIGGGTSGPLNGPSATFRFFTAYDSQTANSSRIVPTHNFVDDLTWNRGKHTLQFGANIRFARVITSNYANSWPWAVANGSWVPENGKAYMPGACTTPTPACSALPLISGGTVSSFADGWVDILGMMSQSNVTYNYNKTGAAIPFGDPIKRKFATNAWEYYAQDNFRIKSNLNVVFGLRWSLNSPPWEVNGNQVSPDINMGDWFNTRAAHAAAGIPDNQMPLVSFDLAGAANGKPGYYPYKKDNFAPRLAFSYTPNFDNGILSKLTGGPGKMVIRGGYSLVHDNMGLALANRIDTAASFGMASNFSSPYQTYGETYPGIRFVNTSTVPATYPTAPPGGFPATPPSFASTGEPQGIITSGIDNSLSTPYSNVYSLMIGRELPSNMTLEVGYVGRQGRDLTVRRDLAQPLNLVDKVSGMDYFTAARLLINAAASIPTTAPRSAYTSIAPIPFFENMFPGAAGTYSGTAMTATQYMARAFRRSGGDWTTALYNLDEYCSPTCGALGPFAFFNQQWDALGVLSTLGRSEYHSLQASLRKRYSNGLDFTVNYTFSKSDDTGSAVERGSFWTEYATSGYTGILINSFDPKSTWSPSDFDVRHQINANWTIELPFGQKKQFGGNAPGWLNAFIGGWQWNGIYRWSSGYPLSIINCRSCWSTNWQVQGNAQPIDPQQLPATGHYQFVTGDPTKGPQMPSMFKDPYAAYQNYFRLDYPGEGGLRNYLRGDGYFTIDVGIGKSWNMPYSENHKMKFRWEIFNLTNTARFDVGSITMTPDNRTPNNYSSFGSYGSTLNNCDNAAGRCMQVSMRYEF